MPSGTVSGEPVSTTRSPRASPRVEVSAIVWKRQVVLEMVTTSSTTCRFGPASSRWLNPRQMPREADVDDAAAHGGHRPTRDGSDLYLWMVAMVGCRRTSPLSAAPVVYTAALAGSVAFVTPGARVERGPTAANADGPSRGARSCQRASRRGSEIG